MAILIDETKRVIVQGITGREGQARTKLMKNYGTNVIGGCTPGKGGQEVLGVPVYDTVYEAVEKLEQVDISVIFVPAPLVKNAALEAIDAGVKMLVIVPDRVPIYDVLEVAEAAKEKGAKFLGPNTLGCLSVGKAVLGMIGGRAESAKSWFKPGRIGVVSRSGGITSSIAYYLSRGGIGLSSIVHVGGDPILGLRIPEIVKLYEEDENTDGIVMFGEIGTSQEETVAELINKKEITKPIIAYIGGKAAKSGTRFSHAGAIIEGNKGTHEGKVSCLREAGVTVVDAFNDIPQYAHEVLNV